MRLKRSGAPLFQVMHVAQIQIFCSDVMTVSVENGTVNLIVTSPPYNLGVEYSQHGDKVPYGTWMAYMRQWLEQMWRFAAPCGRLCLNIPLDKNYGGQRPVARDVLNLAEEVGWRYHTTVIWNEGNISRRTAWGSFSSPSAPFVICPVEVVLVLYKDQWRRPAQGRISGINSRDFVEWSLGVWSFPGISKKKSGHPAAFPPELPRRCILMFSFTEDLVMDPFMGSGQTLIACNLTGRRGIGIDIDPAYCELAERNLAYHGARPQINAISSSGVPVDVAMEYARLMARHADGAVLPEELRNLHLQMQDLLQEGASC